MIIAKLLQVYKLEGMLVNETTINQRQNGVDVCNYTSHSDFSMRTIVH